MVRLALKFLYIFIMSITFSSNSSNFDLTIVGTVNFSGGLERIPVMLIDLLKSELKINCIGQVISFQDIRDDIANILKKGCQQSGNVSILTDPIWYPNYDFYKKMPKSRINIAYSMFESTEIPSEWVKYINTYFDSVVVPDEWLIDVYQKCGIKVPIFMIPIGLYLNEFIQVPIKTERNKIFTFGMSAACVPGKNQELVVEAFRQEFAHNNSVRLLLHSRGGSRTQEIKIFIQNLQKTMKNIDLSFERLTTAQYIDFLKNLDCYILVSKGEGFSIGPREAMSLGIPCIISNNTAHKTICNSSLVEAIKSNLVEPAYYDMFRRNLGFKFNTDLSDLKLAMRKIYNKYDDYLKNNYKSRQWAYQYNYMNLKKKFFNLIKPKKIILGERNFVSDEYLETNSKSLYNKYLQLSHGEVK